MGKPIAGRQIAIFRDNGEATLNIAITDADGRAEISLTDVGEFLLNAVNIESIEDREVVWESHWASLTFGLPRRE